MKGKLSKLREKRIIFYEKKYSYLIKKEFLVILKNKMAF